MSRPIVTPESIVAEVCDSLLILKGISFDMGRYKATIYATDVLNDYKNKRNITDFQVICDESNNTAHDLQRGFFLVKVLLKMTASVEIHEANIDINQLEARKWQIRKGTTLVTFTKLDVGLVDVLTLNGLNQHHSEEMSIVDARFHWARLKHEGYADA